MLAFNSVSPGVFAFRGELEVLKSVFVFLFFVFCAELLCLSTNKVFKCTPSHISTTERSFPPLGFHELIHFSSHTLTFTPDTLFMSAGRGYGLLK